VVSVICERPPVRGQAAVPRAVFTGAHPVRGRTMPAHGSRTLAAVFERRFNGFRSRAATPRRWRANCDRGGGSPRTMSQKTVHLVIGRLFTDDDLRSRFAEHPLETLTDLREQGFELTVDEIEALVDSDPDVWPLMAERIHPRLHRSSLSVDVKRRLS